MNEAPGVVGDLRSSGRPLAKAVFVSLIFAASIIARPTLALDAVPEAAPKVEEKKIDGVGMTVNPAGDCVFNGDARHMNIQIPGNDHALMTEQKRMTAPRVLQEVTGDFTAQVKVSGSYSEGGGTVIPGRNPFQGAGLLLWVDADEYIRLERAQVDRGEDNKVTYVSWEPRVGGKALHMGNSGEGTLSAATTSFRLTRKGNEITASVSEDGTNWRSLAPVTIDLPATVQIGVVAGHNKTTGFEADFENFSVIKPKDGG